MKVILSMREKEYGVGNIKNLKEYLQKLIDNEVFKNKEFWIKNSNYEEELCKLINMELKRTRYYDAIWNSLKIEIKKGRSVWLDLVRYGEILLGKGEKNTITMFIIPDKTKTNVHKIFLVKTEDIIKFLKINVEDAEFLLEIKEKLPRSLNAQASLTIKDLEEISFYIIEKKV